MPHVQIRNVPPKVHAKLKKRAAKEGMSLSEYLLREVTDFAERPTFDELSERIRRRSHVRLAEDPAVTIRRLRDGS